MLHGAIFGETFRPFLCLTITNMAVSICRSTTGWMALKLLHHAETWRRGTEFVDFRCNFFMCCTFWFANRISSFSVEISCLNHCFTGLFLKRISNGSAGSVCCALKTNL
jgi:hypothetical protein